MLNFLCQFWSNKLVPFEILYLSSVLWKIIPLYFFSSNNIYFAQKEPIKVKIFETFECSGQNLSNSLCQFWSDKSIPLQIFYPSSVSWKITPLYFFSSNNIYFAQKEHIKMKIFETYKCSIQNSSNFSCQFWNDKPIPSHFICSGLIERVLLANQGHFFRGGWQGCSKGSKEEQISILYPFISIQSTFLKAFILRVLNTDHGQH